MNQRIFELAELALEETHRVMGSTSLQEAFDDFYTEKFAELIVKECADIQMKRSCERHGYDKYEDAKEIKEHFGVTE